MSLHLCYRYCRSAAQQILYLTSIYGFMWESVPAVLLNRKDGVFLYFEDNPGVIVNNKGEMKGSAITGPVAKECADLWPRIASNAGSIA
uniref:Large ribosomal subunit protein uL14 n=1 Tax=Chelydra serpentina TaxID=8475 RepID=A0A8C3RLT4_CHESE